MTRKLTLLRENELTSATSFNHLWGSMSNDEWRSYLPIFSMATGEYVTGYGHQEDEQHWELHPLVLSKLNVALVMLNAHFRFNDQHPYVDPEAIEKAREVFMVERFFRNDKMLDGILFELVRRLEAFASGLIEGDKLWRNGLIAFSPM